MSGSNGSGGGCLLWFIHWTFGIIRNRRIRKYNKRARGLQINKNTTTDTIFPQDTYRDNIIISGGSQTERMQLCEQIILNAYNVSHPIIILHAANGPMENIIAANNFGIVISERNKKFDAFASFEFNEIFQVVTETCKSKYEIKPAGRYILQVVYSLLESRGSKPFFSGFANCPYFKLSDQIVSRLNSGSISQDAADELNSLLLTGQSELPKIDAFFSDMKSQTDFISAKNPKNENAVGVLSAIKMNQILCIDIKSSSNDMLLELIVNSLIIAMNRGFDFSLLIDDISFTNNEMLKNAICQKSNHRNIILSKDLFSLTGGKEDVFSAILGEAEKTVLFRHGSGASCDKWSMYLGEYERVDVSYNRNAGWSRSEKSGFNSNIGQTESLKRERKVNPEQIRSLSDNEAILYDKATDSLVHTRVM